jgi:hypothetical protein
VVPFPCCSLEGVSESVIIGPLLEEPMLTSGSAVTLKAVGDDSYSTLEEEEDTMRLYVCVRFIDCVFKISYRKTCTY